jgi:uncharacterized membrane protein YqiK
MPNTLFVVCLTCAALLLLALVARPLTGLVVVREQEVGIVAKRFARRSLAPGRLVALNGEAGIQADTLSPGYHLANDGAREHRRARGGRAREQAAGEAESLRLRAASESDAARLRASGDAEAIQKTGEARAAAYAAGVAALGPRGFTALQLMQIVGEKSVRVVPDVAVSGNGSGLAEGLLGMLLRRESGKEAEAQG